MKTLINEISAIIKWRQLVQYLFATGFKERYKNMFFGVFWAVLDPLFMTVIYVLLVSVIFKRGGEQFPLYLLAGLLPYRWISLSLTNASKIIFSNGNIIKSVRFPFSILVLNEINVGAVNFLMGMVIFIPMMFIYGANFSLNLLFFPVLLALQYIFIFGLGLIFSTIGVYFRDIQNILNFGFRILLYLSPVLYSLSAIPERYYKFYLIANPLATLFENYKRILVEGKPIEMNILIFAAYGLLFLIIGSILFKKYESSFSKDI